MANDMMVIEFSTTIVKSRPCENSLADFCTSTRLNALKMSLLYSKKADGKAFRSAEEVQNPLENFHMVSTFNSDAGTGGPPNIWQII